MKFKATTKAKTLLDWFRAIRAVADECVFDTSETDVVAVRVVDPANALMLDLQMPGHAWDVLETESGVIGVYVDLLIERVKLFDSDASVTMSLEGNEIVLTDGTARWTVKTMAAETLRKAPRIPEINLPSKIIIDASVLQRLVKRAATVSDHITIGLNPAEGNMFVRAVGDTGDYTEPLLFDGDVVVLAEHRVAVQSLYSLDYTTEIAKVLSGDVVLKIGNSLPILISFVLHNAIVCYVQAPRIEEDS